MLEEFGNKPVKSSGSHFCKVAKMLGEALQVRLTSGMMAMTEVAANDISEGCVLKEGAEEEDVFIKLWHQAMAEVDFLKKLASATSCDKEELVQEKEEQYKEVPLMIEKQDLVGMSLSMQVEGVSDMKADTETMVDRMHSTLEEEKMSKEEMDLKAEWIERRSKENFAEAAEQPYFKELMLRQLKLNTKEVEKHADAKQQNYIMKAETNEVGEVVKMLGKAAQMKMTSKLLEEEAGKVVTKANPEAREEKFNNCDNSFPHEPGADSEQSKIKEMKEIDPWARWIRWRRCGAAECFPRLSKKAAEVVEAQASSKGEKTMFSHPEMKVKKVFYTVEQCRLLAEIETWGEENAEPGLHVELLPASKDLLAEVEAWGHEDAEADSLESSESKEEAEVKLAAHITKAEAVERRLPMLEKVESNSMINELAENSASNQLEEELKKEQGGDPPLIIDKENLVEVSLSKKVKMRLMHILKAEAVQVRNMEQKLMQEEFLKFCKQYLMVEECEKEGHEALQLQVDKQAAAAG